jgi:hypothetical protein
MPDHRRCRRLLLHLVTHNETHAQGYCYTWSHTTRHTHKVIVTLGHTQRDTRTRLLLHLVTPTRHTHKVGLPLTSDRPFAEAYTFVTQTQQTTLYAPAEFELAIPAVEMQQTDAMALSPGLHVWYLWWTEATVTDFSTTPRFSRSISFHQ